MEIIYSRQIKRKRFLLLGNSMMSLLIVLCLVSSVQAQPFFESTWSTALGRSDNAVRDGGIWDINEGNGDFVDIQSITGPGLPEELANLNMATVAMDGDQGWQMVVKNVNTDTADDFYFRYYVRVKPAIDFQYAQLHPWQDFQDLPDGLSTNFYIGISNVDGVIWQPAFWSYTEQEAGMPSQFGVLDAAFGGPDPEDQLQVNQWYRIEGHLQYLDRINSGNGIPFVETIYTLRVYDAEDHLVLSNEDLRGELCDASGCTYHTLQSYYDQGHRFRFRSTSSTFTMGVNSPAGASGEGEIYDMTAVAFSNEEWIGAYCSDGTECDSMTSSDVDVAMGYEISLSPNPVSNVLSIYVPEQRLNEVYIQFFDLNGVRLRRTKIEKGQNEIDVSSFNDGALLYVIEKGGVKIKSGRLIKIGH